MKKSDLAVLAIASVTLGSILYSGVSGNLEYEEPLLVDIPDDYSNFLDYVKVVDEDGLMIKKYNGDSIYFLCDKKSYEVSECIFSKEKVLGVFERVELYDISSSKMLVCYDDLFFSINGDYYKKLLNDNYFVSFSTVLTDDMRSEDGYYSYDEIIGVKNNFSLDAKEKKLVRL